MPAHCNRMEPQLASTRESLSVAITDLIDVSLSKLRELVMDREAWHAAVHGVAKNQIWLSDWTEMSVAMKTQGSQK